MNIGILIGLIIIQISNILCVQIWYDDMDDFSEWTKGGMTSRGTIVTNGCQNGKCAYFITYFEMERSTDVTGYENLYFVYYFYGYRIVETGILVYIY